MTFSTTLIACYQPAQVLTNTGPFVWAGGASLSEGIGVNVWTGLGVKIVSGANVNIWAGVSVLFSTNTPVKVKFNRPSMASFSWVDIFLFIRERQLEGRERQSQGRERHLQISLIFRA